MHYFLIHHLGSRNVYQKEKKKWGLSFKKIGDDVIAQKWMTFWTSEATQVKDYET
jgi:hypothetical protein